MIVFENTSQDQAQATTIKIQIRCLVFRLELSYLKILFDHYKFKDPKSRDSLIEAFQPYGSMALQAPAHVYLFPVNFWNQLILISKAPYI